ncbi:MAG: ABC transporter ATP-binding protein [Lachnospiraceae bacterium]|nr:ABC transporter ATP-binding protein [Lachnospiraceae bacterium]
MSLEFVVKSQKLNKRYGETAALKDVNITVKKGSIYGLVGNNGAGKTTFLKVLTGQTRADSGTFTLLGEDNEAGYRKVRRQTGAIIENPGFYPKLTAKQNLEYYRIQRGIPGKEIVDEMLRMVGLEHAAKKKFENLSLGMKQRLGLALALMGEPEFLILDEPINGLDPSGIIEIRNLLLKLNREKNVTILISSHILTELENIATDYGFLNKGELVEEVTAERLKEKCRTFLEVKVTDAAAYAALLETELLCSKYKVLPGNCIHILEHVDRVSDYSALAVKHDIGLLAFEMKEINLENYYMNLIGAENQTDDSQEWGVTL